MAKRKSGIERLHEQNPFGEHELNVLYNAVHSGEVNSYSQTQLDYRDGNPHWNRRAWNDAINNLVKLRILTDGGEGNDFGNRRYVPTDHNVIAESRELLGKLKHHKKGGGRNDQQYEDRAGREKFLKEMKMPKRGRL